LYIKYGHFLSEKVELYKDAKEIQRLSFIIARLISGEARELIDFFSSLDSQLTPSFRDELGALFQVLSTMLQKTIRALSKAIDGPFDRLKFAFIDAKHIQDVCTEIEDWQIRFMRRAVVFLFFGGSRQQSLKGSQADASRLASERAKRIRESFHAQLFSTLPNTPLFMEDFLPNDWTSTTIEGCSLVQIRHKETGELRLIEYHKYSAIASRTDLNSLKASVRSVADKLRNINSTAVGLLASIGFSHDEQNFQFGLVFSLPQGQRDPRSLRSLLHDPVNVHGIKHSINERLNVAKKLASALLYVHSCDLVHKNIRADNVVIFSTKGQKLYPRAIGEPYLFDYESVRKSEADSTRAVVADWERNIYLSPKRQSDSNVVLEFTMQHDIFSLGIVLLEIGLWSSVTDERGIGAALWENGKLLESSKRKEVNIDLATRNVPRTMGDKYKEVVLSCLNELKTEEDNGLLIDQDGIVNSVAYITKVMGALEDIII